MTEKKRIGIEALLRWAYRDELPKAGAVQRSGPPDMASAWDPVHQYGERLAVIDDENVWGLAPDLVAARAPHPDAEAVGLAVARLDALHGDLPLDWHPLDDMVTSETTGLVAEAVARARREVLVGAAGSVALRSGPRFLVVRHALAGTAPDWRGDVPAVQTEMANGKARWFRRVTLTAGDGSPYEIEMDGRDPRSKRPLPGAYRKLFLDPDPMPVAVARAEWETWRAALDLLVTDLRLRLEAHEVLPCERPARPWMAGDDGERARAVLPDLGRVREPDLRDVPVGAFYRRRAAGQGVRRPGACLHLVDGGEKVA